MFNYTGVLFMHSYTIYNKFQNTTTLEYKEFSSFIYRTPLLAFDELKKILCDKDNLLKALNLLDIQEAIYLASPVLYSEIQKLLTGKIKSEKESERILSSAARYISRMCTRCTPFGLFAGCGIGKINEISSIINDGFVHRVSRLDMYYLSALYDTISKNPEIKFKLKYFPNNSLYKIANKYRYIETCYEKKQRKHQITEVDYSPILNKIIKSANDGSDLKTLSGIIVNDKISEDEAFGFIEELISSQILIPELYQSMTGENLFQRIINLLQSFNYTDFTVLERLKSIKEILEKLDANHNSFKLYHEINNAVKKIGVQYEERFLLQVDSIKKDSSASLGKKVVQELKDALIFLNKITHKSQNENLRKFQQDFYNRYEDREVPLMEVLDPDIGLCYPSNNSSSIPSPLIEKLILPKRRSKKNNAIFFNTVLSEKILEFPYKKEIILNYEDFKELNENWEDLPTTIYTMFEVIKDSSEGLLINLIACSGSCGANLMGRFAHIDCNIEKYVREITHKEQELMPDVIVAEIVHSPEARVGNVLFRPHIRDHEILYISDSDLPKKQLILLSDLTLSIRKGRLVIRSRRLNKEIVPRLTTAHNYHNNTMPIYRFLCDMQMPYGRNSLHFTWEHKLDKNSPYLPRVRYQNTILSLARWLIEIKEIKHLFSIENCEALIKECDIWREKRSLPKYVTMKDYDNYLFVDWNNPISIRSLFSIIKKRFTVVFTEFLFEPENAIIKGYNGSYTNECIVAFYKN